MVSGTQVFNLCLLDENDYICNDSGWLTLWLEVAYTTVPRPTGLGGGWTALSSSSAGSSVK